MDYQTRDSATDPTASATGASFDRSGGRWEGSAGAGGTAGQGATTGEPEARVDGTGVLPSALPEGGLRGAAGTNPRSLARPVTLATHLQESEPSLLMALARFWGLDVWGTSSLPPPARLQMGLAAVTLWVVAIFEFTAWSVLFHHIFTVGGALTGPPALLAAVGGGLILATIILIFEVTFLTSDPDDRAWFWGGALFRLSIVFLSAFVTSQVVEGWLFSADIDQRLYEEALRAEAVVRLEEFQDSVEETHALQKTKATELQPSKTAQEKLEQATTAYNEKEDRLATQAGAGWASRLSDTDLQSLAASVLNLAQLRTLQSRANAHAVSNLSSYRRCNGKCPGQDDEERATCAKAGPYYSSHLTWKERAGQIQDDIDNIAVSLKDEAKAKNEAINALGAAIDQGGQQLAKRQEDALGQLDLINAWIQRIRRLRPGQPKISVQEILPNAPANLMYPEIQDTFSDRLAIIDDLYFCRPPRWPEGSDSHQELTGAQLDRLAEIEKGVKSGAAIEWVGLRRDGKSKRQMAAELFALPDPDEGATCPNPGMQTIYQRKWWSGLAVAFIVPLVALFCKIFFRDLHGYYSTTQQALNHQPDARRIVRNREAKTGVRRTWLDWLRRSPDPEVEVRNSLTSRLHRQVNAREGLHSAEDDGFEHIDPKEIGR